MTALITIIGIVLLAYSVLAVTILCYLYYKHKDSVGVIKFVIEPTKGDNYKVRGINKDTYTRPPAPSPPPPRDARGRIKKEPYC